MRQYGSIRLHKGVAYCQDVRDAEAIVSSVVREFPAARVVAYGRGYAVQVRKSGDYIGRNGRPSMENAINAFDRA